MVKTPCFQCRGGLGSIPGRGTKIPHAGRRSQKKKTNNFRIGFGKHGPEPDQSGRTVVVSVSFLFLFFPPQFHFYVSFSSKFLKMFFLLPFLQNLISSRFFRLMYVSLLFSLDPSPILVKLCELHFTLTWVLFWGGGFWLCPAACRILVP